MRKSLHKPLRLPLRRGAHSLWVTRFAAYDAGVDWGLPPNPKNTAIGLRGLRWLWRSEHYHVPHR